MLHILLFILKIIGIILAAALGILLAGAAIFLFVPICYRVKAEGKLGDEIPVCAEVRVTWIFHMIKMIYLYPSDDPLRIHILGFRILKKGKKRRRKKNKKYPSTAQPDQTQDKNHNSENAENTENTKNNENTKNSENAENNVNTINNETAADGEEKSDSDTARIQTADYETEAEDTKKSKWRKLVSSFKTFIKKIIDLVKNIKYTIRRICDKIKQIIENMDFYVNILQSDIFESALAVSKRELFRVLKHIQPSKWKINLTVGTGDPAGAGQILAVYGMLYPFIGNNVNVQADFDQLRIEGDCYIKGSVTVSALLVSAFIIYKDKNIRKLITILKRKDT